LRERLEGKHIHAFHHRRFLRIGFGDGHRLQSTLARGERRGKRPAYRSHASIQRQFTEKHALVDLFAEKLSLAPDEAQRHGQIESRAFLAHIGRGQINRHALAVGKLIAAIPKRALNPLAALFDRVVRQAHDIEVLHARRAYVHLDFDNVGVDSVHRSALCLE
jgi:hypothetical protein